EAEAAEQGADASTADKGFRRTVPRLDEIARRPSRFKRGAEAKGADAPDRSLPAAPQAPVPQDAVASAAAPEERADARDDAGDVAVAQQAPARPQEGRGERAETARVDAALLDALLNGAGEINIFQSRLNQQLH